MARKGLKSLDKVLDKFKDSDGDSILVKGKDAAVWKFCPTDSPAINTVLGSGIPQGSIVVIGGKSSSAKSALALNILGAIQKNIYLSGKTDRDGDLIKEGNALLLDAERAFTDEWYSRTGLDLSEERFRMIESNEGEVSLDLVQEAVNSGEYDVVLVDSINALVPMADLAENSDLSDANMALLARLMSRHLKRIKNTARKRECTVIYVSQQRNNMDKYQTFIESLGGGLATVFYSDIILKCQRIEWIGSKNQEDSKGIVSKVSCVKNKVSKPGRSASFSLFYEGAQAFDYDMDYVDSAIMITEETAKTENPIHLVHKSGNWCTLLNDKGEPIFLTDGAKPAINGKKNFLALLKEKGLIPELKERISKAQLGISLCEVLEDIEEPVYEDEEETK